MSIKFLTLLFLSIGLTSSALAQDSAPQLKHRLYDEKDLTVILFPDPPKTNFEGEYQLWLNKGNVIPFDGVCLNPEGMAYILSEYEGQRLRGEAALKKQRLVDLEKLQLETDLLEANAKALQLKSEVKFKSQEAEIKRLQSINKDIRNDRSGFWRDFLLVGGGVGVGVIVGVVVGLVAH